MMNNIKCLNEDALNMHNKATYDHGTGCEPL